MLDLRHLGAEEFVCISRTVDVIRNFSLLFSYAVREVFLSDFSGLCIRDGLVSENLGPIQLAYFFSV